MKITKADLSIADLREAADNPNRMEPEKLYMLTEAIKQKGFLQPPLVRRVVGTLEEGAGPPFEIIDGHHRVRAARDAGLTVVPALVCDASDDEAVALRIGMNRLRGDLDLSSTARLVQELIDHGWRADDLTITGFSTDEVADLVRSLRVEDVTVSVFEDGMEMDDDEDRPAPKPYALEILFTKRDDLKRAKKALKKAAGKSGDFSKGLLRLIGE